MKDKKMLDTLVLFSTSFFLSSEMTAADFWMESSLVLNGKKIFLLFDYHTHFMYYLSITHAMYVRYYIFTLFNVYCI